MKQRPILPPTYFTLAVLVSIVLHFAMPIVILIPFPLSLLGIALIVFGGVLNIWADQAFKKAATTVKPFEQPSAFIVDGPFRVFRHPMYFGMLVILFGISAICGSLTSFLGAVGFWIVIRIGFIPMEERSMMETFGREYELYKNKTPCWM